MEQEDLRLAAYGSRSTKEDVECCIQNQIGLGGVGSNDADVCNEVPYNGKLTSQYKPRRGNSWRLSGSLGWGLTSTMPPRKLVPIAVAFAQPARTQLGHKTQCLESEACGNREN
jgi:hypothetical protein